MNIINKFSLQKHDGKYESWPLKSSLYYCGEELGVEIPGYVIDKQFELADYFLLFISWDCPFEEACEVYVLNKLKKIVSSYGFNASYNSYNLLTVTELSKNHYKLIFSELDHFELVINYPKKHQLNRIITVSVIDV